MKRCMFRGGHMACNDLKLFKLGAGKGKNFGEEIGCLLGW